ncbi:hypothetical protein SADUNF_Sadunf13G0001700 [Salix dunnii]|uniref:MADS-box domain-containing protein n=1 Tax=Salix dunnii TaxID=1413687 RepID=A0A835JI88_9ROSI|nr:hypothetical protein SADUNF_Sadunf13G0001700 [Salix dunnii]
MTRKKVKLAYIFNDSARKATFKKRKKGLMKKVSELSTLCGVDACAIVYSPYDSQPEVWPSPHGVQRVLGKFRTMPEMEQLKKMVNQESFLRQRLTKTCEHLKRQRKDNREKEVTQAMFQCLGGRISLCNLHMMDMNDLGWMIDHSLRDINMMVETVNNGGSSSGTGHTSQLEAFATTTGAGPSRATEQAPESSQMLNHNFEANVDAMQGQQWFMEMMTPQEHMGFGGDDMVLPSGDNNQNGFWSGSFSP